MHVNKNRCEVSLSKNNKVKHFQVARLVAEAFIPNPQNKELVMHISGNNLDNSIKNLRWAYCSESRHNDYNRGKRNTGKSTNTKISINRKNFKSYEEVRKYYGIKSSTFWHRLNVLHWNIFETAEIPVGERVVKNEE